MPSKESMQVKSHSIVSLTASQQLLSLSLYPSYSKDDDDDDDDDDDADGGVHLEVMGRCVHLDMLLQMTLNQLP